MTTLRIVHGLTHSGSPCAHLVDDYGDVALEWHSPEWLRSARELGGSLDRRHPALPFLHEALRKYALRQGFLIQDGEKFVARRGEPDGRTF